jgi:hypothetical protein
MLTRYPSYVIFSVNVGERRDKMSFTALLLLFVPIISVLLIVTIENMAGREINWRALIISVVIAEFFIIVADVLPKLIVEFIGGF